MFAFDREHTPSMSYEVRLLRGKNPCTRVRSLSGRNLATEDFGFDRITEKSP